MQVNNRQFLRLHVGAFISLFFTDLALDPPSSAPRQGQLTPLKLPSSAYKFAFTFDLSTFLLQFYPSINGAVLFLQLLHMGMNLALSTNVLHLPPDLHPPSACGLLFAFLFTDAP